MAIQAHMHPAIGGYHQDLLMENAISFSHRFSENQSTEIDLLIHAQNERLRMALQEERREAAAVLMKRYEWRIECLMSEREESMARAVNRNVELNNHLRIMEVDNQRWQRLAEEKEAAVASLNGTIQRMRERAAGAGADAGDAESWCCLGEERERGGEGEGEGGRMGCRRCRCRKSCVIMLPCRHLCSCKYCEPFLHSCPVCNSIKKATIEALL